MDQILEDLGQECAKYYESFISILPKMFVGALASILFVVLSSFVKRKLMKYLDKKIDDPLLANFLRRTLRTSIYIIAILLFLAIIGKTTVVTSILGVAGISAFIIGFAFKDIGENFLAGVIMAFKRPFRLGDTIESQGITGSIIGLNLRDTHVKTFDGKDVYIPNAQILKNPLFNYTIDGFLRQEFSIAIDYNSDIKQAMEIIIYSLKQETCILQKEKQSYVSVGQLSPSAIELTVRYWINTFNAKEPGYITRNKAIENCMIELNKAGIKIPNNVIQLKTTSNLPTL